MGQYDNHVFVCTSGDTCPEQGDVEEFVKVLRAGAKKAGRNDVRVNKAGCFSQCGHGPMLVVYPENVWYAGVKASDLDEILTSHILGGTPVQRLVYDPGKPGANKIDVEKKPVAEKPSGPAWHRVCAKADVPANGMKEFAVNGTSVLIAHTGDAYVAWQAMCPHEAIPLDAGICDGNVITCLEHMWQFDIRTGTPVGDDAERGLEGYPLKEEGGDLYVELRARSKT